MIFFKSYKCRDSGATDSTRILQLCSRSAVGIATVGGGTVAGVAGTSGG